VDAVKFQSWVADKIQNRKELSETGGLVDSKVFPFMQRYQLPAEWHEELAELSRTLGVDFLSTPFDVSTARLLKTLEVPAIKVSSSDIVYDELLTEVGSYGVPVFLSTGMATLGEIEHALKCIGHEKVLLFHCVAMYPPLFDEANLKVIETLRGAFGLPIGFSDHFPAHEIDLAAVALGACCIEKHVTLDRDDGAPDSFYSLEMDELTAMVKAIRQLEKALGDGRKRCMPCEEGGLVGGRRCLYAARDLSVGEVLQREDIAVVRPNVGELKPRHLTEVVGRRLSTSVSAGAPLEWGNLK
jgi:sialic acid synthase SpsE